MANSLSASRLWIPVTDPTVLNQLRNTGTATFKVAMANLPGSAAELKIRNVFVNLVGATSTVPSLNGLLTHAGNAQATRRDGATIQMSSPPMTSFVSVGLVSGQVPAAPTRAPTAPAGALAVTTAAVPTKADATTTTTTTSAANLPAYYGRSPVTTWTFALADPTPVNLAGVTGIEVGLDFLAVAR